MASGETGLLHAYLLDGAGGARALDWDGIARWSPNDGILWINLDYSVADTEQWLRERSGIDPLALAALLDPDPRPRAVAHGEDLLLIVRGINLNAGAAPEDMLSVRAWIEPRRIVTLRRRVSTSIRSIVADLRAGRGPRSAGELTAVFVDRILEHVITRVDVLGDEIAACEDRVLEGTRGAEMRAILADHRRRAIALRRFLGPQREAFGKLAAISVPWLDPPKRARIAEAADRMTRTVEELDAARDRAAVTQEELASRVAEVTNQRLYLLAILTAVFLPLGFVCSLLAVPIARDSWPFWSLCGALVVGVGAQLWLFHKRGWL
ncbi:MAG TPA: zinc transporter ZntB [Kofleriaceae bacterium]|nr:zinc transporter ZntB [Kofleriaceae bacterium]